MEPIKIVKRIQEAGFEAFYVGGWVRDVLLKKESTDVDITTNAKYDELKKLFSNQKFDEVGKSFQVLIINGIEVATYRSDHYDSHGGLSHTKIVKNIEDDLQRRDLTINSIAYDPINDKLIDPFGGHKDIKKRKIRFTGDAYKRIQEDPVRMLRACRFLATNDRFRFTEDAFTTMCRHAYLIQNVAKERIQLEIIKAMKAKNAGNFFRALQNTGLLSYVFPRMNNTIGHDGGKFHNESIFEHSVTTCDNIKVNNPNLKIAAFLHDIGKPKAFLLNSNGSFQGHSKFGMELAKKELIKLRFSNEDIDFIVSMIDIHMDNLQLDSTPRTIRRLMVKLKDRNIPFIDFIHHVIADHDANTKKEPHGESIFFQLAEKFENESWSKFSFKNLTVNGCDVMEILNLKAGPKIGKVLDILFHEVVENPELNQREILLSKLENMK